MKMADIDEPDVEHIKKRIEFKRDELVLRNKGIDLRILDLLLEIKRLKFEIENNAKQVQKHEDEMKIYG